MKPITAVEAVAAIEAGTLTSEKLVRGCLDRIAGRDDVVKAWVHLDPDQAIAQAKAADAASGGLLRGIPIGVKDIIDTYDMPTGHNSPIFAGTVPFGDAACVALCRTANAVIMGKTVTTEFANRHAGATTNPHNPAHTPGGSSSGSAAAVADFQSVLGTGTQTGGSVIRPAAFCGIVGYKPSYGHFAPAGMKANTEWLDTIGAYARSVEDIALFRAALMAMPFTPIARLDRPPRIAVAFTHHRDELSPEGTKAVNDAADAFAKAGAQVKEIELPGPVRDMTQGQKTLSAFDGPRAHADEARRFPGLLSESLKKDKLEAGSKIDYATWVDARKLGETGRAAVDALFDEIDVILTAPAKGEAPLGLERTGDATFNLLWTYLWMPCVTLPLTKGPTGLPVGVQLVGRQHEDAGLLDIAAWARGVLS